MQILNEIGETHEVDEYIQGLLAQGKRIMGFGHRIYKVEDPQARHLRKHAESLCRQDQGCGYYEMSKVIEKKAKQTKGIYPNVDFYSATVQHALGIEVEYYTTVFAIARIAGWSAHILEQLADNRLIRPKSQFTGRYPRRFVPLAERE